MNTAQTLPEADWVRLGMAADWTELFRNRSGFQREFVRLLSESPQLAGRVLDIGCGGNLPAPLLPLTGQLGALDGVDPDGAIAKHPGLQQRWQATFETAALPADSYDLAYAYNVLEHIANPRPFFQRLHQVLRPGGVFWGLTPNRRHPFALLSRGIERMGLKDFARRRLGRTEAGLMRVNDYPAYYRCNSPRTIQKAITGLGFKRATFYYHPCLQWDTYFPRSLRWLPHGYDLLLGTRFVSLMQIFIVRLDK